MESVYIAGPYRDKRGHYFVEQNIRVAENLAVKLLKKGYNPYCPHTNLRAFDGVVKDEVFLESGLEFLRMCDSVHILPKWYNSEGTIGEILEAIKINKPIIFYNDNLEPFQEITKKGEWDNTILSYKYAKHQKELIKIMKKKDQICAILLTSGQ